MPADPLKGLRAIFDRPGPRLVTGQPVHNARRYRQDNQDAAVYFAQEVMIATVPHRTLVGVDEIQCYVDEVLRMDWPLWRTMRDWPVVAVVVPGLTPSTGTAVCRNGTLYVRGVESEIIVLHELAHHYAPCRPEHGVPFVAAFLTLIEHVMNPAAAEMLRGCLATEGISA